jgi:flagellar hook-associated protein 1 FlgK
MSLTQALLSSSSGLRSVQTALSLVSSNIANAETPGYVRKTLDTVTVAGGGVRTGALDRELDLYLQRQLRVEQSGGGYAGTRASFYDRLQLLFGAPGSDGTLETSFSNFTTALQSLATSPESYSSQSNVLNAAQVMAQQLNTMSQGVQALRGDAERGLSDAVQQANEALQQIAKINNQIAALPGTDAAAATLMDQRDRYIDQLSQLMDIRVIDAGNNQLSVFTTSGLQLVSTEAAQLTFDAAGKVTPDAQWSADPTQSSLGTITLISPSGSSNDLLANNSIRSGKIAAYIEMRDKTLVEAQAQLDAIAAGMAQMLSDVTTDGAAVTVGPVDGFDVDIAGLQDGNPIRVTYTDIASGQQRTVTFVRVDDSAALPLSNDATVDPDDTVVGINFGGGTAAVASQIGAALGAGFTVSNPSGSMLRILDDGGVNTNMVSMAATRTVTGLTSGLAQLPLFTDGNVPYTGAITESGGQMVGLAGRLAVNSALIADPSKFVAYGPSTAAGDTTRVDFILSQLTQATLTLSPEAGIGSATVPYAGTLSAVLQQVISVQGQSASAATSLAEGQQVVVSALQQRMDDVSGVNIDQEMAHLLQLQTAYGANARVMTAVREMLDMLMNI